MDEKPFVITLKVQLDKDWQAELECLDCSTLEDLHFAIQKAVNFDNDHLFDFYASRGERNRNRVEYHDLDTPLSEIFPLPPKHYLYYLFDYGDNWLFRISRTRKKPKEPRDDVEYPRVVKEQGEKPVQYENYEY